jgi:hypothetical protein
MTVDMKRHLFVRALALYIVAVNGSMAAPSVGHAAYHADHQASAHSSGLSSFDAVPSVVSLPYFFRGFPGLRS